jgi:sulfur carrier protein
MPAKGKGFSGTIPGSFLPSALPVFKTKIMNVFVNNEPRILNGKKEISQLVELLGLSTKGMALAVNNTVVSRSEWGTYELKENDKVTIIKATQGG